MRSQPVVAARPPPNNWAIALALVLVVALLVVVGLLINRNSNGTAPAKVQVSKDVPAKLQRDVNRLQQLVSSK